MISVALKPSVQFAALLAFAHLGVVSLLFLLHLPYSSLIALPILFSMIYSILRYALLFLPDSVVSMRIGEDSCTLLTRGGRRKDFSFHGSTFVSPYLTVLNLEGGGSAAILPDAVDSEEFRQLRVWLRWKA